MWVQVPPGHLGDVMVSTFLVGEHVDARGRMVATRPDQCNQFSTAVFVLTDADVQDARDAIDALVAETQTGMEIQGSGLRSGAPVAVLA